MSDLVWGVYKHKSPNAEYEHHRPAAWCWRDGRSKFAVVPTAGFAGYHVVGDFLTNPRLVAACPTQEAAQAAWRLLHADESVRMTREEADRKAAMLAKSFPKHRYSVEIVPDGVFAI